MLKAATGIMDHGVKTRISVEKRAKALVFKKNIVIEHFSMRRENQTMVDKIPWDTCVIALIFCVFKTVF